VERSHQIRHPTGGDGNRVRVAVTERTGAKARRVVVTQAS
jgi:hypothetical protein